MQAKYKISLDPTVDEIKKLCTTCRKYAKSERVLFHYNGHGVPKPTANGEIWLFNKVYFLTQIAFSGLRVILPSLIWVFVLELYAVYSFANQ